MTRLARYQLIACPKCSKIYKHPQWASISVHVPRSVNPHLIRGCTQCGYQAPLTGWIALRQTKNPISDIDDLSYEQLMRRLGMHMPEGATEKVNIWKRAWRFLLGNNREKIIPKDYPEIKIMD